MKTFILLASCLVLAQSKPVEDSFVHVHQDTAGNYKATYNTGEIFRTEEGTQDGQVKGHFAYKLDDGTTHKIEYTAGTQGFIASGTNLPVAPLAEPENPDVVKAREEHLKEYNEILKLLPITEEFHQTDKVLTRPVTGIYTVHHHGLVPVIKYVPYEIVV